MDWTTAHHSAERRETPIQERFVSTVWTFTGATSTPTTCQLWDTLFGLELRVMRAGELIRSQLCRRGADEAATYAEMWAQAMRAFGFTDVHGSER